MLFHYFAESLDCFKLCKCPWYLIPVRGAHMFHCVLPKCFCNFVNMYFFPLSCVVTVYIFIFCVEIIEYVW